MGLSVRDLMYISKLLVLKLLEVSYFFMFVVLFWFFIMDNDTKITPCHCSVSSNLREIVV